MVERTAVNRDVVGSSPTRGVFLNIRLRGQAVKTSPFHGGNTGSIPVGVTEYKIFVMYADVAQLAEQLICNQQVIGSSPIIGFLDLSLSWLEQPAHNRSVLGSSPRRSIF